MAKELAAQRHAAARRARRRELESEMREEENARRARGEKPVRLTARVRRDRLRAALGEIKEPGLADTAAAEEKGLTGYLVEDFEATMTRSLKDLAPLWQRAVSLRLKGAGRRLAQRLRSRPRRGKAPPSPPRSKEEIDAEIATGLAAERKRQAVFVAEQIERIKHRWMVWQRERALFRVLRQPVAELKGFKPGVAVPDAARVQIPESVKATPGRKYAPVVPGIDTFLLRLKELEPDVVAENRVGHGGGPWKSQGYSVDLRLVGVSEKRDSRGFYVPEVAVRFLRNLHAAAGETGEWRVIYNDFRVAEQVNRDLGVRRVISGKWHGPSPLRLHFHLDIVLAPAGVGAPLEEGKTALAGEE